MCIHLFYVQDNNLGQENNTKNIYLFISVQLYSRIYCFSSNDAYFIFLERKKKRKSQ